MRLTSRTGYGVLALFDLAYHGEAGRPVLARDIARRQAIPLRYLEQILHDLRQAGLVDAKRGPGGGYALARAPADIRLDHIVAALDGPADALFAFDEMGERRGDAPGDESRGSLSGKSGTRTNGRAAGHARSSGGATAPAGTSLRAETAGRHAAGVVAPMWRDLGTGVARLFGAVTLASLVERALALGVPRAPGPAPMYFI